MNTHMRTRTDTHGFCGGKNGLTLIELSIAVGIAVIIAGTFFIVGNPAGLFSRARNSERRSHVNAIVIAIRQNVADTRTAIFTCASGDIPTSSKKMAVGAGNYNIAPCLVPSYLQNLPFDPSASGAHYASISDYDTGYQVVKNASSGEITVSAPFAEAGQTVSVTR
ncbi:MAG: prepilin-type N-terminal cleavage/methylation domain-containing protein [Candidatus Liptonbacteria bacterium]|nr:prepilin-type N-terminal cleavage/methylation domain-containing protein [Candidatus Liptonbacteria bacterium]